MRSKGSIQELEARRLQAGRLLLAKRKVRDVAKIVGASESSVRRWRIALREGGLNALRSKTHPGRPSRLDNEQQRQLATILLQGPRQAGYMTDLWTCRRIARVISRTFDATYHPSHVWRILRKLGWTCRKPERRARERNEEAIADWRRFEWPRIKGGRNAAATR